MPNCLTYLYSSRGEPCGHKFIDTGTKTRFASKQYVTEDGWMHVYQLAVRIRVQSINSLVDVLWHEKVEWRLNCTRVC